MQITELVAKYQEIADFLNQHWPLKDHNQRIFARTMKVVEELGELSDEILTSMNLQRDSKIARFSRENLEDEFADVFGSLVLLGGELDIDIEKVVERKIKFTKERFQISEKV
jgi:NTP pyrophosphatase (non-canonical NTP hydrolase)